jgi:hypothetical protein
MEALNLGTLERKILFNEAMRQRAIDSIMMSIAFNGTKEDDYIETLLKAHGTYTEGFYEDERRKFEEMLKK